MKRKPRVQVDYEAVAQPAQPGLKVVEIADRLGLHKGLSARH